MRSALWICLLGAVLCGCGPGNDSGGAGGKDGAGAEGRTYEIAVIPKGTSHEFWKSIHAGAVKAERELAAAGTAVRVNWKGPLREDDRDLQIQVVENFMVRKADAIVLAPLDSKALVAPVERAVASSIPVVIIDSALDSDKPASYVATDNYKGGQMGAEHLAGLLGGKGNVLLLRYQVGSASTEQREAGFLDVLTNRFPEIRLLSADQYSGATRDSAYKAAETLLQRYGQEVDGVFAPCEPVTIGMMLALKAIQRAGGAVKLVGFDAGSASVQGLVDGDIQGLVVQNPVYMGYMGVKTAVAYLRGEPVEKVIDTGVQMVTSDNMNNPEIKELLNPPLAEYLN